MPILGRRSSELPSSDSSATEVISSAKRWRQVQIRLLGLIMEISVKHILLGLVATIFLYIVYQHTGTPIKCETGKTLSGTSGKLFKMKRLRSFPHAELRKVNTDARPWTWNDKNCKQWAVSTTIWEPSKTLQQIAELDNWCIVVVLDKKTPVPFNVKNAVVLGVEDQIKLPYRIVRRLPWNHFGRKNVGFLYAVSHGAEVVYDCDDDNELIVSRDQVKSIPLSMERPVMSPANGLEVFNPYPLFGNEGGWPRGYPLDQIVNKTTYSSKAMTDVASMNNFYVHQSLANNDPDYDAIYRLTRPLPVTFTEHSPIALPPGTMCPYNAQATLHFKPAFWGMLLPITVHGRVSDIWRSYITQRLLWDIGGRIVFRNPWVVQYRNVHNYLADFDSEYELYTRATALVQYLRNWNSEERNLKRRLLDLCVDLYEHGIFEQEDVLLMNDWLHDLTQAGYEFPPLITN